MGLTEYAFVIKNITELTNVLNIIKQHNVYANDRESTNVGEEITIIGYLNFKNKCHLLAINGGGNDDTERFFTSNLRGVKWYGKFQKPKGFNECDDFIYKFNSENQYIIPKEVITFLE